MDKLDKRIKTSRAVEQEYAHQYTPKSREESYQYPDENSRVNIQNQQSSDGLYNINTEQTIESIESNTTKIKARVNTKEIVEDHRQRSYKIKTQPPIFSRTNIDTESAQNQNNAREDEINKLRETSKSFAEQIENEQAIDMTSPIGRFSEQLDETSENIPNTFNVGDDVVHTEEGIKGKIAFLNDKRLSIVWEDKTRERFSLADAKEFLKVTKAYVDSAQEQVDPIHTPDSDFQKDNAELNKKLDDALSFMENEDDATIESSIDIEKVKLKRKLTELENKVNAIDVEKIKTKAARELVELMQKKGMVEQSKEASDSKLFEILQMDDIAFESFKNAIISTKKASTEEDEIYAILGEDDDFSDIEDGAEMARAREEMKKATKPTAASRSLDGIEMGDTSFFENGGLSNFKGSIGDFSGIDSGLDSNQVPRNLSASKRERKPIERKSSNLDMSGFQNIQGLKTPINIPNKDISVRGKFADLFSGMGWSGIPKK